MPEFAFETLYVSNIHLPLNKINGWLYKGATKVLAVCVDSKIGKHYFSKAVCAIEATTAHQV